MNTAIPRIDAQTLKSNHPDRTEVLKRLDDAARGMGFLTVFNTAISRQQAESLLRHYRAFFALPEAEKRAIDMAATGSNRGWGAPGAEQVDPDANPDYKQVFDVGPELHATHPLRRAGHRYYAANQWPAGYPAFRAAVMAHYTAACAVALDILGALATALGQPADFFDDKFDTPMALLRGNYYPPRPDWATERDFGIASHTDYGCLTLLATDGSAGLEVRSPAGAWLPISAPPGTFIINFGEMLESWTAGAVRATPHRVRGPDTARLSIPLFFNPNHDTNIAPVGSGRMVLAGDHLSRRFDETYLHQRGV